MIGKLIENRYRIESDIGEGGMAEVYRAYDEKEGRDVAIKLIKEEYCSDPEYIRRFEREAQAVLTLECPNIVRAYGYGVCEGRGYLVMELVEGPTLKEYLEERGTLTPEEAAYVACAVLDALSCAHESGYVHRDVKPQNVLIASDSTVKLTDFGIVKAKQNATKTFDGSKIVGSVQYISPEQASSLEVGEKSDLYSVGIMLYEMLIGEPPFDGDSSVQIAMQHIHEPVKAPHELDKSIPVALSDVVLKATAKNRRVRYLSAAAMKADIVRSFRQPNGRFARVKRAELMRFVQAEAGEEKTKKRFRARTWHFLLPIMLMLALVVGMILTWYLLMDGRGDNGKLPRVPDVLGKDVEEATKLVANREFTLRIVGEIPDAEYEKGHICRQSPSAGTANEKGAIVEVWISSGGATVTMRSLIGMPLEDALSLLESYGISVEAIDYGASESPEGTVIWQSIPEGTEVVPGEESITIEISGSRGTTLVPMPNVTNIASVGAVNAVLDVYGVTSRSYRFEESVRGGSDGGGRGVVASQSPAAGIPFLPSATPVELELRRDAAHAFSDISFEMLIDRDGTEVRVALESQYGEFTLYQATHDKKDGATGIEFTAPYLEAGEYRLIVYTDGEEAMSFNAVFR